DFHYGQVPILPLASTDHGGLVAYAGSFTKAVSPAFRMGYLVADRKLIDHLVDIRRILDRMGDPLLEMSILELLRLGTLQRSLRRARLAYQKRRDCLAGLLTDALGERVRFRVPDGGMAIWTEFDRSIKLPEVAARARVRGLGFSDGRQYGAGINATRLGFASSTEVELGEAMALLAEALG
ncbi:MAG: aminotransferase class I/II-fold pyridoxal phosphate-dependent enzyme, partial [Bacteroidota bacterium]